MTEDKLIRIFFEHYEAVEYKKGYRLISPIQKIKGMYYLEEGLVLQYAGKSNGLILNLHTYKPGSCFPMLWMINSVKNRYYFESITDITIRIAPEDECRNFLYKHPELVDYYLHKMTTGIGGLLIRMESLIFDSAYDRTNMLFEYLGRSFGKKTKDGIEIEFPLTHKRIAEWIGTTRETASIQVEKMVKDKILIKKRGGYIYKRPA